MLLEGAMMSFEDVADREQLSVLTDALNEICLVTGMEASSTEGDATARLLAHLYKNGHRSAAKLRMALSPATLQARFG
jgi:hypothetical protein